MSSEEGRHKGNDPDDAYCILADSRLFERAKSAGQSISETLLDVLLNSGNPIASSLTSVAAGVNSSFEKGVLVFYCLQTLRHALASLADSDSNQQRKAMLADLEAEEARLRVEIDATEAEVQAKMSELARAVAEMRSRMSLEDPERPNSHFGGSPSADR